GPRRDRSPTLNHVERSPRADAVVEPVTGVVVCVPCESEAILTVLTRRDELRLTVASRTRPATPNACPSALPVAGTGPQLWYGEIPSYGSRTETRYGRAEPPQASEADCVRPPELDE